MNIDDIVRNDIIGHYKNIFATNIIFHMRNNDIIIGEVNDDGTIITTNKLFNKNKTNNKDDLRGPLVRAIEVDKYGRLLVEYVEKSFKNKENDVNLHKGKRVYLTLDD